MAPKPVCACVPGSTQGSTRHPYSEWSPPPHPGDASEPGLLGNHQTEV